jgi:hypothetical protein
MLKQDCLRKTNKTGQPYFQGQIGDAKTQCQCYKKFITDGEVPFPAPEQ